MSVKDKLKQRASKIETETAALCLALRRKDTPILAKVVIGVAVCYALSPIDLIPDFVPVVGFLDDLLLIPLLLMAAIKLMPPEILEECRQKSAEARHGGKRKSIACALPVAAIWLAALALIVKAVL